jgi:hypothetical protein
MLVPAQRPVCRGLLLVLERDREPGPYRKLGGQAEQMRLLFLE